MCPMIGWASHFFALVSNFSQAKKVNPGHLTKHNHVRWQMTSHKNVYCLVSQKHGASCGRSSFKIPNEHYGQSYWFQFELLDRCVKLTSAICLFINSFTWFCVICGAFLYMRKTPWSRLVRIKNELLATHLPIGIACCWVLGFISNVICKF